MRSCSRGRLLAPLAALCTLAGCARGDACEPAGQTRACTCPSGASGTQTCGPGVVGGSPPYSDDRVWTPCVCAWPAEGLLDELAEPAAQARGALPPRRGARCELATLDCDGRRPDLRGWKLNDHAFELRNEGRHEQALCALYPDLGKRGATPLRRSATHYEMAENWRALECPEAAREAIAESVRLRPYGRGGWRRICALCAALVAPCPRCGPLRSAELPLAEEEAAFLALMAAATLDDWPHGSECLSAEIEARTQKRFELAIREKHEPPCPGVGVGGNPPYDPRPMTAPIFVRLRVDRRSGKVGRYDVIGDRWLPFAAPAAR